MLVKQLKLHNFRNHIDTNVEFCNGINILQGQNGQGKTNLVESLMVAATTKSPRTSKDADMVCFDAEQANVEIIIERKYGNVIVEYVVDKQNGKTFKINHNEIKKISDVFGNLVAVYFSPDELKIVSDSPNERREFMDTEISMLSGTYYNLLQRYTKVLSERNKLLKTERNRSVLLAQIEVWDEQLSMLAAPIVKTRKAFVQKLKVPASEALKYLSKQTESLDIEYVGAKGETIDEIKKEVQAALEYNLEKDIELGYTSIGPHRDDIRFLLSGTDARSFASNGQQRSIVLALKLAEATIFEQELGEPPILVFDDVFSELDARRQAKLYEVISKYQSIITGTNFKFKKDAAYSSYKVKNGIVKRAK